MPLRSGYSRDVVSQNIAEMISNGVMRANAVAAAYAQARVCFFKSHPHGALQPWLAFPANYRMREHYNKHGIPVRNLHYRSAKTPAEPRLINPIAPEEIKKATRRFSAFTGNSDVSLSKIKVNSHPKVLLAIGPADGLLYSTIRDGKAESYIHRFASQSRPLLAASPDGKRLYLLGGAYTFTQRGIVDKKRRH